MMLYLFLLLKSFKLETRFSCKHTYILKRLFSFFLKMPPSNLNCPWGEISIPHKLGFSEISPPQSLLPSNVQILNFMLINLNIIVFILFVIHCVWQSNKINK